MTVSALAVWPINTHMSAIGAAGPSGTGARRWTKVLKGAAPSPKKSSWPARSSSSGLKNWYRKATSERSVFGPQAQKSPFLELPLTGGVVGGGVLLLAAPWLAALGALAAIVAKVKIEIVREYEDGEVIDETAASEPESKSEPA